MGPQQRVIKFILELLLSPTLHPTATHVPLPFTRKLKSKIPHFFRAKSQCLLLSHENLRASHTILLLQPHVPSPFTAFLLWSAFRSSSFTPVTPIHPMKKISNVAQPRALWTSTTTRPNRDYHTTSFVVCPLTPRYINHSLFLFLNMNFPWTYGVVLLIFEKLFGDFLSVSLFYLIRGVRVRTPICFLFFGICSLGWDSLSKLWIPYRNCSHFVQIVLHDGCAIVVYELEW